MRVIGTCICIGHLELARRAQLLPQRTQASQPSHTPTCVWVQVFEARAKGSPVPGITPAEVPPSPLPPPRAARRQQAAQQQAVRIDQAVARMAAEGAAAGADDAGGRGAGLTQSVAVPSSPAPRSPSRARPASGGDAGDDQAGGTPGSSSRPHAKRPRPEEEEEERGGGGGGAAAGGDEDEDDEDLLAAALGYGVPLGLSTQRSTPGSGRKGKAARGEDEDFALTEEDLEQLRQDMRDDRAMGRGGGGGGGPSRAEAVLEALREAAAAAAGGGEGEAAPAPPPGFASWVAWARSLSPRKARACLGASLMRLEQYAAWTGAQVRRGSLLSRGAAGVLQGAPPWRWRAGGCGAPVCVCVWVGWVGCVCLDTSAGLEPSYRVCRMSSSGAQAYRRVPECVRPACAGAGGALCQRRGPHRGAGRLHEPGARLRAVRQDAGERGLGRGGPLRWRRRRAYRLVSASGGALLNSCCRCRSSWRTRSPSTSPRASRSTSSR